jgi:outer membrane usher protein
MVNGDESIVTNDEGLALVPYATPYRQNSVTLSDTGNSSGAEIVGNIANSVPYAGAVNYLRFETDQRRPYTLRAVKPGSIPLPFGAEVADQRGYAIGFVGQASVLYLRVEQQPESLEVRLNDGACKIEHPQMTMDSTSNICR